MLEIFDKNQEELASKEAVDAEFAAIVDQIDATIEHLSIAEMEAIEGSVTSKPNGYADQGYRHG